MARCLRCKAGNEWIEGEFETPKSDNVDARHARNIRKALSHVTYEGSYGYKRRVSDMVSKPALKWLESFYKVPK